MKTIRITESCSARGRHFEAGTTAKDVDTDLAAELVGCGRAVEVRNGSKETVETRDPVPENRDPETEAPKDQAKKQAKKSD